MQRITCITYFTGSNYTSSFSRKEDHLSDGKIVAEIQNFICKLYGTKRLASVDKARLKMFLRKYETKNLSKSLTKIKKLDATTLPPCCKVLHNNILRAKFASSMWVSSILSSPP